MLAGSPPKSRNAPAGDASWSDNAVATAALRQRLPFMVFSFCSLWRPHHAPRALVHQRINRECGR